jgi:hypothetical protein
MCLVPDHVSICDGIRVAALNFGPGYLLSG